MNILADEDGFTLLETLVAFAIMVMAFAVFYPIFSNTHTRIDLAKQRGEGLMVAIALMEEELLVRRWVDLPKEGETQGWSWRVSSAAFDHASNSPTAPGELIEVRVVLTHSDGRVGGPIELNRVVWQQGG